MRTKIILICILLISINGYSQTCVIAKKTKDAIYVGADRKVNVSTIYPNGDTFISFEYIKKIFTGASFNYALIGKFWKDVDSVLIKLRKTNKSLFKADSAYVNLFLNKINIRLREWQQINNPAFKEIKRGEPFSQIVFFGKESDSLFIYVIKCRFNFEINAVQLIRSVRTDLYYGGETKEISDTLETNGVWKRGVIPTIKSLIDTSAKYNYEHVGGTTDIYKFTLKGGAWVKNR